MIYDTETKRGGGSKAPCCGCKKRQVECHSKCELYIAYRKKLDVHLDAIRKFEAERRLDNVIYSIGLKNSDREW